ncbi:hypothetical protein SJI00_21035 [Pseudomonas sp. RP23018S]|uniref:hypothetical protein n=1 Tax=Pseudomonas sp. RP23018S TaxID=3096037 RepID=UPI002ACAC71F|nr:hypothetical protein [Pseudomonas sp. RP23018S]MDZ5605262.1 hypothetical protein [Pseudomonas sp. RP23018S]
MTFISSNATPALLSTAAKLHELDDALDLIQGVLGIRCGAVAAEFLTEMGAHNWAALNHLARLRILVDYVTCEQKAALST